jgi:Tol biopolymer transport system component/DNA-binding winged helix-turn-helix (wHTH) protein
MPVQPQPPRVLRFGIYEIDVRAGELRKSGVKLKLQEQPFEVLCLLVERPGEVVTREELRNRLWPADTFVDFDHSVNAAIKRLRDALGDSADNPHFVETLARRGYRFIGSVEMGRQGGATVPKSEPISEGESVRYVHQCQSSPDTTRPILRTAYKYAALVSLCAALAGLMAVKFFRHSKSMPPAVKVVPLVTLSGRAYTPAFSPDGNQVIFAWDSDLRENSGLYIKLIGSEKMLRLTNNADDCCGVWAPDGRSIAFYRGSQPEPGIYIIPALGGGERKLTSIVPRSESFQTHFHMDLSPDGKFIAFPDKTSSNDLTSIFLLSIDDFQRHKLTSLTSPSRYFDWGPAFSPDGKQLAFVRESANEAPGDLYLVSSSGGEPRRLTFDNRTIAGPPAWTPDGGEIIFSSSRAGLLTLWRISASGGEPKQLSGVGTVALQPALSKDGHRLAYQQVILDSNLWRMDIPESKLRASTPRRLMFSSQIDQNPQFSPDGEKVAFVSNRSGTFEIWMCDADGSNAVQLTSSGGAFSGNPRWSPDGRQIAFDSRPESSSDIFVIDVAGGAPIRLTKGTVDSMAPSWSKDGRWIYFASIRNGTWQVWKVAAQGGQAIQVTRHGGFAPFESPDGRFVYYAKAPREVPGVWRVSVGGGAESPVLELLSPSFCYNWAVAEHGIYFIDRDVKPHAAIKFFDFATHQVVSVAPLNNKHPVWNAGLTVSPDGRSVVYALTDKDESNIILLDNFR